MNDTYFSSTLDVGYNIFELSEPCIRSGNIYIRTTQQIICDSGGDR